LVVVTLVLALAVPAAAQTDESRLPSRTVTLPAHTFSADSPSQQLFALQRWTHDYDEWKAWFVKWRGRLEPGLFSAKPRRQAPVPPAWLPDACTSLVDDNGPLAEACRAWHEWLHDNDGTGLIVQRAAQARAQQEAQERSVWWEHVHLDALWPMTQSGSSAYGVAGMHTTLYVTKRLQVFVAPGAILMRLPAVSGGRTWSAATDWGFSWSLFDFRMPGTDRPSTVHLNMARVWVLGGSAAVMPGELYLAGFSITFKRR
jgi:hypothetical protein